MKRILGIRLITDFHDDTSWLMSSMLRKRIGSIEIHFLGGFDGVGGNLILLEGKRDKVVLDFGIQFSKLRRYYTWPIRTPTGIEELIDLGIAPNIRDLYACWDKEGNLAKQRDTNIQAIFISHYHLDHCYLLPQANRNITIYMGKTTKIFFDYYKKIKRRERKGLWRPDNLDQCIRTFRSYQEIECGEFKVTPIHVDHSSPGSYGFIVESKDATIAYTGDFRFHGPKKELTSDFIQACKERGIDLLITEGTNFFDVSSVSEEGVKNQLYEVVSKSEGLILASFGMKDIDRFRSYYEVAMKNDRGLLMSYKHLLLLKELKEKDEKLRSTIPDLKSDMITAYYRSIDKRLLNELREYNLICVREDLSKHIDRRKIITSFVEILQEISLRKVPPDSIAIFSESEPIDEESQIEFEKIVNWLEHLAIPSYRIHCSGHIYPFQLRSIVKEIKPKNLEVIHSNHPLVLRKYLLS